MKIRIPPVNESPDDADVHFLDDRINQYNFETTGITDGRIISFFVRDELGDVIVLLENALIAGFLRVRWTYAADYAAARLKTQWFSALRHEGCRLLSHLATD